MATFYTGNTGGSTGPHLDFRVWDVEKGSYVDPRPHTGILSSGGKGIDQFNITSGYGMRNHPVKGGQRMHHGIDYGTPGGTKIDVAGTYLGTTNDQGGGGITSQYSFVGADGRKYEALVMHGDDKLNKITSDSFITDGTAYNSGDSTEPLESPGEVQPDTDTDGPTLKQVEAKERAQKFTPENYVEGLNNFSGMKSQNLAEALKGAQVDILKKRMDNGEDFGFEKPDATPAPTPSPSPSTTDDEDEDS